MSNAIVLENKGRAPIVIELPGEEHLRQQDVLLVGRDKKTGAAGQMTVKRAFPRSLTLLPGEKSEPLPAALKPAVAALAKPGLKITDATLAPEKE